MAETAWTDTEIKAAAQAICRSGKFESGQGTCAALCMSQLGDPRQRGCHYAVELHGKAARTALAAYTAEGGKL